MVNRKIKYIAVAVKWWDKLNGNTYHSVRITRVRDGKELICPFTYGYDDHYRQTALAAMVNAKWIPTRYKDTGCRYEKENNYPIHWVESWGLKRECVDHGTP